MNDLTLLQGDCLELMKNIPDGSVDLVLTDPPYGISLRGKRRNDVFEFSKVPSTQYTHPTQKPIDLLCEILNRSTDAGGLVLDCFMGSGSTGVACVNTGRKFIGIELDKGYFDIAQKRIAEAKKVVMV